MISPKIQIHLRHLEEIYTILRKKNITLSKTVSMKIVGSRGVLERLIDLLQEARFEDTKELINNRLVTVTRGQIPISLRFLGTRWGWSTKKVNSFLDMLLSDKMIAKETPKETGQTVVTICNYNKYNFNSETRKQQKKQTGNNINKENKYNNIFSPPAYVRDTR